MVAVDDRRKPPSADRGGGPVAEDDVRVLFQRYVALVEHAPDAIVVLDVATGRFLLVNPAAERLFGRPGEELLTVGPVELSPPVQPDGRSSAEAAAEHIARAVAGEQPTFEWTHRRADGSPVTCEVTLLRLPGEDRDLVRGSIVDLGDRRAAVPGRPAAAHGAAAQSAGAAAARLEAMVAGLNAIVWERDAATWRIRYINERAEQLLGYPVSRWVTDENLWT
jgi:PAS domain S-box-containing protein